MIDALNSLPQAVHTATAGTIPSHLVTRIFLLGIVFFAFVLLFFAFALIPFCADSLLRWFPFALVRGFAVSVPRRRLSHRFPE